MFDSQVVVCHHVGCITVPDWHCLSAKQGDNYSQHIWRALFLFFAAPFWQTSCLRWGIPETKQALLYASQSSYLSSHLQ